MPLLSPPDPGHDEANYGCQDGNGEECHEIGKSVHGSLAAKHIPRGHLDLTELNIPFPPRAVLISDELSDALTSRRQS